MRRRFLLLAAVPAALSAQAPLPLKYSGPPTTAAITAGDLMTRLYIVADDSMMGREAGTIGHMMGTAYIAAEVKRMGLVPGGDNGSYFQNVPFISRTIDPATSLTVDGAPLTVFTDYVVLPFRGASPRQLDGVQAIFGGVAGDTARALTAEQATGKLVIFTGGQLGRQGPNSPLSQAAGYAIVQVGSQLAAAVVAAGRGRTLTLPPQANAPMVTSSLVLTTPTAQRLLGGPLDGMAVGTLGKRIGGNLRYVLVDAPTRNVVAILPGSDATLRSQYVAVGAHSDHIGYRAAGAVDHDSLHAFNQQRWFASENPTGARLTSEQRETLRMRLAAIHVNTDSLHALHPARRDSINNGADDDGSGTVTVLEIAEAYAKAKKAPARSILFVWHTGEEKGLLGSRWFADHPTVPRDSIVAQVNIDMVGRGAKSDLAAGGDRYLQVVGSRRLSTELGDLAERVNASEPAPFTFDYAFDANGHPDNIYCRSDHYNYARYGIPVVFLTTGLHGDYHQVTDEAQYIDYPHMERVARYVFDLVGTVAGLQHRPVVDGVKPDPTGACRQ